MPARPDGTSNDRLVFLHGFTQTHHHWHEVADLLARSIDGHPTRVFVDLPGHGISGGDRRAIAEAAAVATSLAGRGTWIGYSMGGRVALHAALVPGHPIERLVLIGATAGIEDAAARAERRRLDEARARRVLEVGVDAFVDEWLAGPLFATLPTERAGVAHRRRNTAEGLAHSLRSAGTGDQDDLWPRLATIDVPVLVLAGERDDKFVELGRRLADALPRGEFAAIADAGHAAHTERPAAVAAIVADWVRSHPTVPTVADPGRARAQPSARPIENDSP